MKRWMSSARVFAAGMALALSACSAEQATTAPEADEPAPVEAEAETEASYTMPEGAEIVILDAELAAEVIDVNSPIQKLTEDRFGWSEGPVWIKEGDYLLFTDVPGNTMYKWSEAVGLEVFLQPSGLSGEDVEGIFREPGANGLIPGDFDGTILMGDHGNRAIARLDLATKEKTFLATTFEGKRFSSPNDLVLAPDGAIFFTDPPYGLKGIDESPAKELEFNGVYRWAPSADGEGTVTLVDNTLSRPNGVILSPDGQLLYVANSDPERAVVVVFEFKPSGVPDTIKTFADLTDMVGEDHPGLPDGMAMDTEGRLYLAGPGGVHVFMPDGTPVLRIDTGSAAANCTFGGDGSTLYITSGSYLARVELKTTGLGFGGE